VFISFVVKESCVLAARWRDVGPKLKISGATMAEMEASEAEKETETEKEKKGEKKAQEQAKGNGKAKAGTEDRDKLSRFS
jgi:hypothetical protein